MVTVIGHCLVLVFVTIDMLTVLCSAQSNVWEAANEDNRINTVLNVLSMRDFSRERQLIQAVAVPSGLRHMSQIVASGDTAHRIRDGNNMGSCTPDAKKMSNSMRLFRESIRGQHGDCTTTIKHHTTYSQDVSEFHHIHIQRNNSLVVGSGSLYAQVNLQSFRVPVSLLSVLTIQGAGSQLSTTETGGSHSICLEFDVACVVHQKHAGHAEPYLAVGLDVWCKYTEQGDYERCGFQLVGNPFVITHYFHREEIERQCKDTSSLPSYTCSAVES